MRSGNAADLKCIAEQVTRCSREHSPLSKPCRSRRILQDRQFIALRGGGRVKSSTPPALCAAGGSRGVRVGIFAQFFLCQARLTGFWLPAG